MINARTELLAHVSSASSGVEYVDITSGLDWDGEPQRHVAGTLDEVLPLLDLEYDNGYGSQELLGTVWYADGTWSSRGEYDGSE